ISVIPSERPVRNASSSSAAGCLPCPIRAEPWPIAGTTVASRNLTVWTVPFKATAVAASRANAPDDATNEHSAPQSPLNSRRFSALFTPPSFPLRRSAEWVPAISSPYRMLELGADVCLGQQRRRQIGEIQRPMSAFPPKGLCRRLTDNKPAKSRRL